MTPATVDVITSTEPAIAAIQAHVEREIEATLATLPDPAQLSAEARRGIIARYASVLEGNFIYWMTGAYVAARSDEAREKIIDNLREEIRDCHPGMMHRFALAAGAAPTDTDTDAVYRSMMDVRLFIGRLSAVPNVIAMAFFEGFIQRFMAYLADLATRQGSTDLEYTDVHGVCDVTHTAELFNALEAELALAPALPPHEMFEGIGRLRALIGNIVTRN
jgi:Iron-containing redox enzyme